MSIASVFLFLAILMVILPIRSCINRLINKKSVNVEETTPYREVALNFPGDYDRENPLTKQKGIERLHNLHIELLKKDGK